MENYEREFARLNSKQQEAVNAIDGPVLVVAGPGTGKTQLLSMRVANILIKTDAKPNNILCLTFTNKASTNMRDRLIKLVGPESRGVQVKTFHGFASEIINSYPEYFWSGAKLTMVPETTQLNIVEDILRQLPFDNPLALRFSGRFTATKDVMKGLDLAKDAGLTPEKLSAIIKANLAYIDLIEPLLVDILSQTLSHKTLATIQDKVHALPDQPIDSQVAPLISLKTKICESLDFAISQDEGTNKATNTSEWKRQFLSTENGEKGLHKERARNEWWLHLSDVYAKYRDIMHSQGFYDYSDMLVEVLTQLEKNPSLLSAVQEQYSYILIDEFQDSNSAQLRLAHLIASHETANGRPNIMAVGDDDQSIYGFNGAELNNMLFFDRNYTGTNKIVLNDNYRSNQAVLDASQQIIDQAEDRLVTRDKSLTKELLAKKEDRNPDIQHIRYKTREHQFAGITKSIANVRKEHPNYTIAVLARGHESLESLASILLRNNIPVSYEKRSNILELEAIKQVMTICQAVLAIQQGDKAETNANLVLLAQHPMWGIPDQTLWDIALDAYKNRDWLVSLQRNKHTRHMADWLFWISRQSAHQPLELTIEYILGLRGNKDFTSPIKTYFAGSADINSDYLQTLSAFQLLRHLVNDFTTATHPTLADFVEFMRINQENGKIINDESPFVSDDHAVELYSIHKAKGLEFDVVYIIDAIEKNWQPKTRGRKNPANLPLRSRLESDDDYIRLMYVATTRAKHTLVVNSYSFDHADNEVLPTPIIHHLPTTTAPEPTTKESTEIAEETLRWPQLSKAKEQVLLQSQLQNFSINVSNLHNFLDVTKGGPQHFLERSILRLPEAKSPTLAHGTASHSALELAQKQINTGKLDITKILKEYVDVLGNEHLPKNDFLRYSEHGQKMLKNFFSMYQLPKDSKTEQKISGIRLIDATIDGKLDRVDIDGDKLTIVDYKTGSVLSNLETTDKKLAIKAWRQKTQLIFYALLAQNHPKLDKYKTMEGQIVYLEAKNAKDLVLSYTPTQDEIDRLQKLIEAVWAKVQSVDFVDTSNYSQDMAGIKQFEQDLLDSKV